MLNQVLYSDHVVIQDAGSVWTPYAQSPQPHLSPGMLLCALLPEPLAWMILPCQGPQLLEALSDFVLCSSGAITHGCELLHTDVLGLSVSSRLTVMGRDHIFLILSFLNAFIQGLAQSTRLLRDCCVFA